MAVEHAEEGRLGTIFEEAVVEEGLCVERGVQSSMYSRWEGLGSSKLAKERKAVPFWKTSLFFFSRMVPSIINCDSIIGDAVARLMDTIAGCYAVGHESRVGLIVFGLGWPCSAG